MSQQTHFHYNGYREKSGLRSGPMVDGCPMARSLEVSASAIWYMAQRTLVDASVDGSLGGCGVTPTPIAAHGTR